METRSMITLLITVFSVINTFASSPLQVTAADLISKVYSIVSPGEHQEMCREMTGTMFNMSPVEEFQAEWISSGDGFNISYEGMQPEADAMARYEDGRVVGYGYIFYFPYASACREMANGQQCEFCSALLQELADMGIVLGADPMTEALFDVAGNFDGGNLQVTLRENIISETIPEDMPAGSIPADREGEFILYLSIIPV